MAGRILYHIDFDKNNKSLAIDDSVQDEYLVTGEWYLLPEDAFKAAKEKAVEKLEEAKRAAEKATSVLEEAAEKACGKEEKRVKKMASSKEPVKDFEFHVKF